MALCTNAKSTEQRLEAMKWYFGKMHCRHITFTSDDSDHGATFELNVIDYNYAEKKYLVFLNDGVTPAPTPATGVTLISVTVTAGDTAQEKAEAIELALAAVEVRTEVVVEKLEIMNWFVGTITTEVVDSPLVGSVEQLGFGGYIGQTGESELTITENLVQLLDDAQGAIVQDEIKTGVTAEISIPLREMTTERWKDLVGKVSGANITINSSEITGFGTSKLYQSMFNYSGRLVGHPVRNLATNIAEDIVMLNTAPKMESINFSGSSIQEASFMFTSYKDANAPEEINLLARGNHSKF